MQYFHQAELIHPLPCEHPGNFIVPEDLLDVNVSHDDVKALHHSGCPIFQRSTEEIFERKELHTFDYTETRMAFEKVVVRRQDFLKKCYKDWIWKEEEMKRLSNRLYVAIRMSIAYFMVLTRSVATLRYSLPRLCSSFLRSVFCHCWLAIMEMSLSSNEVLGIWM